MVLILRLIWIEEMSSSIFGYCYARYFQIGSSTLFKKR